MTRAAAKDGVPVKSDMQILRTLVPIGVAFGLMGCGNMVKEVSEEEVSIGASNATDVPIVVAFDAPGVPVLNDFINWKKPRLHLPGDGGGSPLELMDPAETQMQVQVYRAVNPTFGYQYQGMIPVGHTLRARCDDQTCSFEWEADEKKSTMSGTELSVTNDSGEDCYLAIDSCQMLVDEPGVPADNSFFDRFVEVEAGSSVTIPIKLSAENELKIKAAIVRLGPATHFPVKLQPFQPHSISVGVLPDDLFQVSQKYSSQRVAVKQEKNRRDQD